MGGINHPGTDFTGESRRKKVICTSEARQDKWSNLTLMECMLTDSTGESRRKNDHLHLKSKAAQVVKPDPDGVYA